MSEDLVKAPVTSLVPVDFQQIGGANVNIMISAIFAALSRNIMSGDVLALSFYAAEDMALKAGVPQSEVDTFMLQVFEAMDTGRRGNSLSKMF